jgi:hypothetical protein
MKPKTTAEANKKKQSAVKVKDLKPVRDAKGGDMGLKMDKDVLPPGSSGSERIATNHNETTVS